MDKITDRIWLGSKFDAGDRSLLEKEGVTHILNCALDLHPLLGPNEGFSTYHIGLRDGSNERAPYIAAMLILNHIVSEGHKVLVHCHMGVSRSAFVVACSLVKSGLFATLAEAETFIKTKRKCVDITPAHYQSFDPLDNSVSSPILKGLKEL
jgi:dual specificity MAP kinase phosphatase